MFLAYPDRVDWILRVNPFELQTGMMRGALRATSSDSSSFGRKFHWLGSTSAIFCGGFTGDCPQFVAGCRELLIPLLFVGANLVLGFTENVSRQRSLQRMGV